MPRDIGTGLYHYPEGTPGNPAQTIFSTRYNTFINDLTNTLNQSLPINMGGTGGTSIDSALVSMSGEKATQIVTDYNNHLWMPGSFRSDAAAPGAPNPASKFAGICYIGEALANPPTNQNVVVEARDLDSPVKPGLLYTRQKTAGVWSAWNYAGTGDDQTAARSAIYAAPFDAMAYNGMQVNGSMDASQQNGGSSVTFGSASTYVVDGWMGSCTLSGGQVNMNQQPLTTELPGIKNCLQMLVTAIQPTIGSSTVRFMHPMEGYRFARTAWGSPAATPITISFWVRASLTGTYRILVMNFNGSSLTAWVPFTYIGGFQWITVTVPGQTTGTWKTDNTTGAYILFEMTSSATPNLLSTINHFASITGVVVLPGTQAPTAAQSSLIMRPYDQELVTCKRYWQKLGGSTLGDILLAGYNIAPQNIGTTLVYPVEMRAAPTATYVGTWTVNNVTAAGFSGIGTRSVGILAQVIVTGSSFMHTVDASTYIPLDARL